MKNIYFKLCLMFLFLPSFLCAQDFTLDKDSGKAVPNYLGQIKIAKGQIFKSVAGELQKAQVGTRFYKNDILITRDKSFAKMLIVDDTLISVGPESELDFAEFSFKEKTDRKIIYSLIKGQVSGHVKQKAKEGDVIFKTRFATMGVRGTEVLVNYRKSRQLEVSEFALLSGEASVTDDKKLKHELTAGKRVVIIHDSLRKESALGNFELTAEEIKTLQAKELDPEKEVKPLMPYFELTEVKPESSLYTFLSTPSKNEAATSNRLEMKETPRKNWKENLDKLNKQLKENQNP